MRKVGRIFAIIPARGGSKGLPGKNILPLAGKPLIAYTIEAALRCPFIARCLVTTDDPEIEELSESLGAEVIQRPPELAGDTAVVQDAVRHVLETLKSQADFPEYFTLLQPTSPLRNEHHLRDCIRQYFSSTEWAAAISVVEAGHHPYKAFVIEEGRMQPLFSVESLDLPRQVLPKVYDQSGAIYIMPSELFLERDVFFAAPALPFIMSAAESIDIDTEIDLLLAETILSYRKE